MNINMIANLLAFSLSAVVFLTYRMNTRWSWGPVVMKSRRLPHTRSHRWGPLVK